MKSPEKLSKELFIQNLHGKYNKYVNFKLDKNIFYNDEDKYRSTNLNEFLIPDIIVEEHIVLRKIEARNIYKISEDFNTEVIILDEDVEIIVVAIKGTKYNIRKTIEELFKRNVEKYNFGVEKTLEIVVSREKWGYITGKNGNALNEIQKNTSTKIILSKASDTENKIIVITGNEENCFQAKEMILSNIYFSFSSQKQNSYKIIIPEKMALYLLARKAEEFKILQVKVPSKIFIEPTYISTNDTRRALVISGNYENFKKTKETILEYFKDKISLNDIEILE
ncbi:KH domain-containing protein [Hamiltosporidium tvaerminnensis]|uniref:KH domain-containing protein n=2 Tax=Hamiltosporidium TaxID=1176354 RepID=A0A4Q9KZ02_9MICR|nr:KH domain-containing protein [Hamiltosporidium magnivora]TBU01663.1 KH domain-containing protein [Hamiltosporidium tvaerminnensis]